MPLGVALYWIVSNLFAILQTAVLNRVIDPKKHVDYEALEASRKRLHEIEALQPDRHSAAAKENAHQTVSVFSSGIFSQNVQIFRIRVNACFSSLFALGEDSLFLQDSHSSCDCIVGHIQRL